MAIVAALSKAIPWGSYRFEQLSLSHSRGGRTPKALKVYAQELLEARIDTVPTTARAHRE